MFLNQELKKIQEAKNRLSTCCDLRRQLVHIEVHTIWGTMFKKVSHLGLSLAIIEQILEMLRERKDNRS